MTPEDRILRYWKKVKAPVAKPPVLLSVPTTLTNMAQGLGDTVILTDIIRLSRGTLPVYSPSPHFEAIRKLILYALPHSTTFLVDAPKLISQFETGNGHFIQRLRRAYGFAIDLKPRGFLGDIITRKSNNVVLHFEAGAHSEWQKTHVHPRARMLYPNTKKIIEKFIAQNPHYDFIVWGNTQIKGASNLTGSLYMLVNLLAGARYFVGIMSGPLHVAAALNIPSIAIINFPHPNKIYLPTLKTTTQIEEEWFYPQNTHLHQEPSNNPHVPQISLRTLSMAFNKELYPFGNDKYLNLINECQPT